MIDLHDAWRAVRIRVYLRVCCPLHDLVTALLRSMLGPTVHHRNHDKPHRCPGCHAFWCTTAARPYRLFRCRHCDSRWWPGLTWQRAADVEPCWLDGES